MYTDVDIIVYMTVAQTQDIKDWKKLESFL